MLGTAGTARPPLPSLQEICVDFRRIVHRREKRARTTQAAICSWPEPFQPLGIYRQVPKGQISGFRPGTDGTGIEKEGEEAPCQEQRLEHGE